MNNCLRRRSIGPRTPTRRAIPLLALCLAACATTAPVDQIKYFSQAFGAVNTVGQPLLDDLSMAERAQGRQIAVRRARGESKAGIDACPSEQISWQGATGKPGIIRGFCLGDAGYFSDLDDPPATAQLRAALTIIDRYADLLSMLADGRNSAAALGDVDALGQNVSGLLGVAGVLSGPFGTALLALRPILMAAAKQANAAEARRLILAGAGEVSALIEAMRQATPAMFDVLIEAPANRMLMLDQADALAGERTRVEAYRLAVANYTVLLGKLEAAWKLTVAAANAPPGRIGLAELVQQTAALKADADAARRVFSTLRSGASPRPEQ